MVFLEDKDTIFSVSYTGNIYDKLSCQNKMIAFPNRSHALMSENVDDILPEIIEWLTDKYRVVIK